MVTKSHKYLAFILCGNIEGGGAGIRVHSSIKEPQGQKYIEFITISILRFHSSYQLGYSMQDMELALYNTLWFLGFRFFLIFIP